MKHALIISFSWLKRDPRVLRQIYFLKEKFNISAVGFDHPGYSEIQFYKIVPDKLSIFNKFETLFYVCLNFMKKHIGIVLE